MASKWEGFSACDLIRWAISVGVEPFDVLERAGLSVSEATIKVQSAAARRGKDIPALPEALQARLLNGTARIPAEGGSRPLPGRRIAVASPGGDRGLVVISTGNTGVAAAALFEAERAGFQTGGFMPKGFGRDGKDNGPDIAQRFGLKQCRGTAGFDAVLECLKNAQAVVRVAGKCAQFREAIPEYEYVASRPLFDLCWTKGQQPHRLGRWLRHYQRVAFFGNPESFDPGIFKWAKAYFRAAFAYRGRSRFRGD